MLSQFSQRNGLGCNFCDKEFVSKSCLLIMCFERFRNCESVSTMLTMTFSQFFVTNVTSQAISLWTLWKHFFKWTFNFMNSTHMTSQSLSFSKTRIPWVTFKGFLLWWTDLMCLFKLLSWWFKLLLNVPSGSINH